MYNSFFGFREKPFKLVPNPDYLFLSKGHEIALAHLNYATDQGDGFVVIIGEVGTGKTTLCRNYLEQLDNMTDSAYIFNPQLDAVQLLASICHEYAIETSDTDTVKKLLDRLNHYLITQNTAGRKVVLLIDEAQGLSVENLELVRMISNLETTRSKLLQIILVGQPELGDRLESYELRQLAQRISLNCCLEPLTEQETAAYIQHRLSVAALRRTDIFSADACRQIHRHASGIPRLINIACDRVLLAAYSRNCSQVPLNLVKKITTELTNRGRTEKTRWINPIYVWLTLAVTFLLVAGFVILQKGFFAGPGLVKNNPVENQPSASIEQNRQAYKIPVYTHPLDKQPTQAESQSEADRPAQEVEAPPAETAPRAELISMPKGQQPPVASPPIDMTQSASDPLQVYLSELAPLTSRINALTTMLKRWSQPRPNPDVIPDHIDERSFFQIAARQYGLRTYVAETDWSMIKRLNLPAVIVFNHPQTQQAVYLALVGWENEHLILADGGLQRTMEVRLQAIQKHAKGTAYVFWKNTLGYDAIISQGANTQAVLVVKTLLRQVGYPQVSLTKKFDRKTRTAIMDFQKRHHIGMDGLVGPLTKIFLIQEANAFKLPSLNPGRGTGA